MHPHFRMSTSAAPALAAVLAALGGCVPVPRNVTERFARQDRYFVDARTRRLVADVLVVPIYAEGTASLRGTPATSPRPAGGRMVLTNPFIFTKDQDEPLPPATDEVRLWYFPWPAVDYDGMTTEGQLVLARGYRPALTTWGTDSLRLAPQNRAMPMEPSGNGPAVELAGRILRSDTLEAEQLVADPWPSLQGLTMHVRLDDDQREVIRSWIDRTAPAAPAADESTPSGEERP